MNIDNTLLDDLTAQAKASPRLRMNLDLRDSAEDSSQRMLNVLENCIVIVEFKNGAYEAAGAGDVLNL